MLGGFDIHEPRIVCPGDPSRSVMLYRMAKTGHGHMPHIGATMIRLGNARSRKRIGENRALINGRPVGEAGRYHDL